MQREGPGLGGSTPGTDAPPKVAGGLIVRVFHETPDVILMLQLSGDGFLRCQTAISSFPTAPSLAAVQGLVIEQILPPDVLARFGQRYEEATKRKGLIRYEEHLRVGDADIVLDAALTPIFDEQGACTHLFWSARNVTDQWTTRESLKRTEERLRTLEREHAKTVGEQGEASASDLAVLAEQQRAVEEQAAAVGVRERAMEEQSRSLDEQTGLLEQRERTLEERLRTLDAERQTILEKEGTHDEQRKALEDLRETLEHERASIDTHRAELEEDRSKLRGEVDQLEKQRAEIEG
ncbi:MAG TPA: hypothetical protein VMP42_09245, partial [Actinomycetota bacterium]|nr:hypothetical protein [Actinomycetota bacterium]